MNPQYSTLLILVLYVQSIQLAHANCEGERYRLFDDLVGIWDEYELVNNERRHLGTLTTEYAAGGCALKQSLISPDKSFSFESLGYLDEDTWIEHYTLSIGKTASYQWSKKGRTLVLSRISGNPDVMKRLVIFDISKDSYYVADEESTDHGKTWVRQELVHTVRRVSERE